MADWWEEQPADAFEPPGTGAASSLLDPLAQPSQAAPDSAGHRWRRLYCGHCGNTIDVPMYCGNRFCPVCSTAKRARARARLVQLVNRIKPDSNRRVRFITLTIPNYSDVTEALRQLVVSFKRLRQRQAWRNRVVGGCFVLEVTGRPNAWHAHIHALVEGDYFPIRLLVAMWSRVSPGKVCWIQRCPPSAAVKYMTKYLTKLNAPAQVTDEIGRALSGYRMFQPFGSWHGVKLTVVKVVSPCKHCGHRCWQPVWDLNDTRHIIYDKVRGRAP
jgi:hypothetical protein